MEAALPTSYLVLYVLGLPRLYVAGNAVEIGRHSKVLALLAYLVAEPHPHTRAALAALLWPGSDTRRAQQNLRQLLHRLRRLIRDNETQSPLLISDRETVYLPPGPDLWSDLSAFEAIFAEVRRHRHRRLSSCAPCLARLEEAITLSRGDFLAGLGDVDSVEFEQWLFLQQDILQRDLYRALFALAEHALMHQQWSVARQYIRRLLQLDPWNEAIERMLLRLLTHTEGRNTALQEFRRFRKLLHRELDVEPEDATLALAARIERDTFLSPSARRSSLPLPLTPFFGREREKMRLMSYLAHADQRLISIVGPGGSGKTRLALEVAAEQALDWRDGVWFIPLVGVDSPAQIVDAIAAALSLPATEEHLLSFLRQRELLLVLDNFEHLLPDGAVLLQKLIRYSAFVKVLITSQVQLSVPGEWIIRLEGLSFPHLKDPNEADDSVARYSAVQLFLHHAKRVKPDWEPNADSWPHIVHLCQMVEGLPLGIELMATWRRTLSCREIVEIVDQDWSLLQRGRQTHLPERQQSLRRTFARSYALLNAEEQRLFRYLSVFQGSFDLEAATVVADADLPTLLALLDRSLLLSPSEGQWRLWPLLRRFAAERLAEYPDDEEKVRSRHAAYYLARLEKWAEALVHGDVRHALDGISAEIDNVRTAWRWASAHGDATGLVRGMETLTRYYLLRGAFHQGEQMYRLAAEHLLALGVEGSATAQLLAEQARFLQRQGRYTQALDVACRAWKLAHRTGDPLGQAMVRLSVGEVLYQQGKYTKALRHLRRALTLAGRVNASQVQGEILRMLGYTLWRMSRYDEAGYFLERASELDRTLGDRVGEAWTLNIMGLVAENSGFYEKALDDYHCALTAMQDVGNRWGESIVLGNLGYLYGRLGLRAEGRSFYRQDLLICREIGDRRGESWTLAHLGLLAWQSGRSADALRYAQQALNIARDLGEVQLQATALTYAAHALTDLGRWAEAGSYYDEATAKWHELGDLPLEMETRAGLVRLALAHSEIGKALALAEVILQAIETDDLARTDEQLQIYYTCFRALQAAHDPRAEQLMVRMRQILRQQASRIKDRLLRLTFLMAIPIHASIVALTPLELIGEE